MSLVEYDTALEWLKKKFSVVAGGNGQLALVGGALASGKTELLRELARHAAGSGALVLSAGGAAAERSLQGGVVDQLFRSTEIPYEVIEQVTGLTSVAGPVTDKDGAGPGGLAGRFPDVQAVHGIGAALLEISRARPVVVCVDDAQFTDSTSQQFLLYLGRRLGAAQVLIILVDRELPQLRSEPFAAEIIKLPHQRIKLAFWSEKTVREKLSNWVGAEVAAQLAPAYHDLSGGNPVLFNALLKDVGPDGTTVAPPIPGAAFRRAVLACLQRWEPELLEVALGLAVLGPHATPVRVGRLTGIAPESVSQTLEILTAASLLRPGRFRHPAAEAAVLGSLPPGQRARMHVQAAALLSADGVAAIDIAEHFAAAGQVDGAWSIGLLRKAAEQALTVDDAGPAVRYLELALGVGGDQQDQAAIVRALMQARWRVNPSAAAVYLPRLETAVRAGRQDGHDAVMLIRYGLWHGDDGMVANALDSLRASGELSDSRIAVEIRLIWQLFFGSADACPSGLELPTIADGAHDLTTADPWPRVANALVALRADGMDADGALASAECILQSRCLEGVAVETVAAALSALVHRDRFTSALSWCDALIDEASRRGAITWQAFLTAIRADIRLRCGATARAASQAREALSMLSPESWGVLIAYPLATLLSAGTSLGDEDSAAEALRYFVPDAAFKTIFGVSYLHARGHYHLSVGRALDAAVDFQACGELMGTLAVDSPSALPWRGDLAEAYFRLGKDTEACALVAQQLELTLGSSPHIRGTSLRVLAACQQDGQLHPDGPPASACLVRVRPGAEEIAEECGQQTIPIGLSDAELRVAVLAAAGHTNREIGRKLWITVSTVEQHLTRVYRKLGLHGRSDLSAVLPPQDAFAAIGED